MKVIIDARTDLGQRRKINEDSYGITPDNKLVVVCDGMGGHNAGEVASSMAVDTILQVFQKLSRREVEQVCPDYDPPEPFEVARKLVAAIRLANYRINSMAGENLEQRGMGTTVATIFLDHNYLIGAHVGDSRIYRFRANNLEQLTIDHTWIGEFSGDDDLEINGAFDNIKSNVITRAVGIEANVKIDVLIDAVEPGDRYLVCSDGLTGPVPDSDLIEILKKHNSNKDAVHQLIKLANQRGGPDNITAVIITVAHIEAGLPPISKAQTTVKEKAQELAHEKQKILNAILHKAEDTQIKFEKPIKKKSRRPLGLILLLLLSTLVIALLILLPARDQLLNKLFKSTQQMDSANSTVTTQNDVSSQSVHQADEGIIKFLAFDQDHAEIVIDQKKKFKLGQLKNDGYELRLSEGSHSIEIHLDGFIIRKVINVRSSEIEKINLDIELDKLKQAQQSN